MRINADEDVARDVALAHECREDRRWLLRRVGVSLVGGPPSSAPRDEG